MFGNVTFSHPGYEVFLLVPLVGLCGSAVPRIKSVLANSVQPSHQAQIFTAFSAVESVASILSHLFNVGYSYSVTKQKAALMFNIMAVLGLFASSLIFWLRNNADIYMNLPENEIGEIREIHLKTITSEDLSTNYPSSSHGLVPISDRIQDKYENSKSGILYKSTFDS